MNNTNRSFSKFLILWAGEFISAIGSGLTSFGLGVYVFTRTGSASAMALVTLLAFLPSLLLGAAAGVLADRYDRRLLMVAGDSLSALGLIYILFCMFRGDAKLWQICIGVTVSSVFSSLMEPAYKATVTDLLTQEEYAKASGLVQVAGSAKYLISPVLAGIILSVSDIRLLLLLDIATFFVTVASTLSVRGSISSRPAGGKTAFSVEFREGWRAVSCKKGVLVLVIVSSAVTFFLGFIQTLSMPLILAFSDSRTAGVIESAAAMGMLAASLLIGIFSIKGGYVRMLCVSLFLAGIFMVFFGLRENAVLICTAGFLFFAMLPFANTSLDYLVRTNIDNDVQGRAWGLIGVISQLGYVAAYAVSGVLADAVFTPLLLEGGGLAVSVGKITGTGTGRGTGFLIMAAGLLLCVTSVILYRIKPVRSLESRTGVDYVLQNHHG